MNIPTTTEIRTIEAAAKLILDLCKDSTDERTKLERIAYTAAVVRRQADAGLKKVPKTSETVHA